MVNAICNGKHPCQPDAIMLIQKLLPRVTNIILPYTWLYFFFLSLFFLNFLYLIYGVQELLLLYTC